MLDVHHCFIQSLLYAHNDYDSNDHVTCDLDHTKLVVSLDMLTVHYTITLAVWYQEQLYCRTTLFVRKNMASKIIMHMAAKSVSDHINFAEYRFGFELSMKLKLFGSDKILEVFCNHLQKYFRRVASAQTDATINHLANPCAYVRTE